MKAKDTSTSTENQTNIAARDLTFFYSMGARLSDFGVSDLNFSVEPGQCLLVTGDSGSGKSTLVKLLNGLIPHFHPGKLAGQLTVSRDGVDFVPSQQPLSRAIEFSASVFQNPRAQFFTESVDAELAFGLENLGMDPDLIEERIQAAVSLLGIERLRGRRLKHLSGGQLQTVACACALASLGGLVLFDEPTSNLSVDSIDILTEALRRLKQLGKTIVIAEHRLFFLNGIADQVLYLQKGKVARRFEAADFFGLSEPERRQLGLRSLHRQPVPVLPTETRSVAQRDGHPGAQPAAQCSSRGLELRDVRFSYGKNEVINLGHAHFPAGEVTALIGPNGAGKTTLARLICGLSTPRRGGSICLGGKEVGAGARRKAAQMVMQDVGRQLFAATVEEEVTLGLPKKKRDQVDVRAILRALELDHFAKRHPQSLSGGQRQRLAIATAEAEEAQVYVFDEPTSGVGWRHLQSISALLRSLADSGAVVIVITHDHEFIRESATRIIDMNDVNKPATSSNEIGRSKASCAKVDRTESTSSQD